MNRREGETKKERKLMFREWCGSVVELWRKMQSFDFLRSLRTTCYR